VGPRRATPKWAGAKQFAQEQHVVDISVEPIDRELMSCILARTFCMARIAGREARRATILSTGPFRDAGRAAVRDEAPLMKNFNARSLQPRRACIAREGAVPIKLHMTAGTAPFVFSVHQR